MSESKVQKRGKAAAVKEKLEKCDCGGEFAWMLLAKKNAKMVKMCDRCLKVKGDG